MKQASRGAIPTLKFTRNQLLRVGIDLGGTKIEGIVLDQKGRELCRERIDTQAEGGYAHVLDRIAELHRRMAEVLAGAPHALGIGTPGAVSRRTGLQKNSNTIALNGRPLARDLESHLGRRCALENDANCFAMAEALAGAGRDQQVVFGVIMGTGCGGGLAWRGQAHTGLQSIAGEWGHMVIDPNGPMCYCGQRGCVETFISGSGVERNYRTTTGSTRSMRSIVDGFRGNEPACIAVMDEFLARFGRAVANLIAVLDPDIIVLGGGLSNIAELYTRGIEEVRRRVFSDSLETLFLSPFNKAFGLAAMLGTIARTSKQGMPG